jgi:hypothetical protein
MALVSSLSSASPHPRDVPAGEWPRLSGTLDRGQESLPIGVTTAWPVLRLMCWHPLTRETHMHAFAVTKPRPLLLVRGFVWTRNARDELAASAAVRGMTFVSIQVQRELRLQIDARMAGGERVNGF